MDNTSIAQAFDILKQALQNDHEYAWGWHCNVAMSAYDAGCSHKIANEGAARFMQLCFNVDTSKFSEYEYNKGD